jgi:hypothetical protein
MCSYSIQTFVTLNPYHMCKNIIKGPVYTFFRMHEWFYTYGVNLKP